MLGAVYAAASCPNKRLRTIYCAQSCSYTNTAAASAQVVRMLHVFLKLTVRTGLMSQHSSGFLQSRLFVLVLAAGINRSLSPPALVRLNVHQINEG